MTNFIHWYGNIEPTYDVEALYRGVKTDRYRVEKRVESMSSHWTTFKKPNAPDQVTLEFYSGLHERVMSDLGMYNNTRYDFFLWAQVYGPGKDDHEKHDHFGSGAVLSWVHFLKPPEQNCFCFVDSYGNEIYPECQRKNDIIFFPPWASHKVVSFDEGEDRMVIAGNTAVTLFERNDPSASFLLQTKIRNLDNNTSVYQKVFVEK